jgi:hypothetical protein
MSELKTIFGLVIAVLIFIALMRKVHNAKQDQKGSVDLLFAHVKSLFENPVLRPEESAGIQHLEGAYAGQAVQLKTIVDTLAVRKLPSLWLMVTLPCAVPVSAKLDMMQRPAGVTSFSNFDFLDHTLKSPDGFPEFAVLRSDKLAGYADLDIVKRHIGIFANSKFKELLITQQGLRLVLQIAEASRAHYGVLRDARFGDVSIDRAIAQDAIETLLALKAALVEHHLL